MGVCCTQCTYHRAHLHTYWHSNYVLNFVSITPSHISFVELRHKLKLMISFGNVCVLYHHGWHNHQWKFQNAHIFKQFMEQVLLYVRTYTHSQYNIHYECWAVHNEPLLHSTALANNGNAKVISAYWFYERKICLSYTHSRTHSHSRWTASIEMFLAAAAWVSILIMLYWKFLGLFLQLSLIPSVLIRLTKNQPLKFIIDTFFGKFNVIGFAAPI